MEMRLPKRWQACEGECTNKRLLLDCYMAVKYRASAARFVEVTEEDNLSSAPSPRLFLMAPSQAYTFALMLCGTL
jgi:hypothetical protein